ncbi:hypothetical protein C8D70_12513 [Chryseobacterium sp. CBTAP 102]|uniref:hypothetical protein n=1 Tax=Chryseobacterium sp. CBTAP 102 TaxID=2135644 RepID=UPI000D76DE18|nr:hypothetical protein [Chryseobacterium sp. CBTAP 102]PXW06481.1 hypothetical protein C8D70_12513 [Chryseobacterium sp. CBTAP 102]
MQTIETIQKTKTETLKKNDRVVMHSCYEATLDEFKKIWKCSTNSYIDKSGEEVVFLDGFSGCFLVKYLQPVSVRKKIIK